MPKSIGRSPLVSLLGPAMVAGVAYLDPGNVASNITAGSTYGFLLVWVAVLANLIAWMVQFLSARLGIVTGLSLPEVMGQRITSRRWRFAYWIQGELVAMATDVAEVVGGAIALHLLFGLPLWMGGILVGIIALVLLGIQSRFGPKPFERVIVLFILVIVVGFGASLLVHPVNGLDVLAGLVPRFDGAGSVLLATAILGATVMPHAIYAHSALSRERFGEVKNEDIPRLLAATRIDVTTALAIAGAVNITLIVVGGAVLSAHPESATLEGAFSALGETLGTTIAVLFAVGLLASSLASTAVGAYAGAEIMSGLTDFHVHPMIRRAITIVPAVALLAAGFEPTTALIVSQVVLSFGIPFALIPLIVVTTSRRLMGEYRAGSTLRAFATAAAVLVVIINGGLIALTLGA
ncbi:MAG: divalent metal cation transporter MntH [Actinomycetota bacterium]|jgi:manganese transport protein